MLLEPFKNQRLAVQKSSAELQPFTFQRLISGRLTQKTTHPTSSIMLTTQSKMTNAPTCDQRSSLSTTRNGFRFSIAHSESMT
jgi:hypothetical protein